MLMTYDSYKHRQYNIQRHIPTSFKNQKDDLKTVISVKPAPSKANQEIIHGSQQTTPPERYPETKHACSPF